MLYTEEGFIDCENACKHNVCPEYNSDILHNKKIK